MGLNVLVPRKSAKFSLMRNGEHFRFPSANITKVINITLYLNRLTFFHKVYVPPEYFQTHRLGGFDIAVALLAPEAIGDLRRFADSSLTAVTPAQLPKDSPLIVAGYPGDKDDGTLWKCWHPSCFCLLKTC